MARPTKSKKHRHADARASGKTDEPALGPASTSTFARLFVPVDITFLVYFRIVFGVLMLWLGWQHFHHEDIQGNPLSLIDYHYIQPDFHFTYYGFGWVRPWPGDWVNVHCYLTGLCAVLITVGLFYRFAAAGFFLGITYLFLLEQANYLNHYYLICLLSLLMVFVPAHRKFSLDAWLRPRLRSDTAPAWTLWLFRFQFGLVYFFAGVAKCTPDWFRCEPVRTMLRNKQERFPALADFPAQGQHLFSEEWFVGLVSYSGMLFDLLIVPLMLWRKTRWAAFAVMLVFHLSNTQLFHIDIFPWLMISATVIFFYPDLLVRGSSKHSRVDVNDPAPESKASLLTSRQTLTAALVSAYVFVQLSLPLRPFLYPGNVLWNGEGFRFSWRMLSRDLQLSEPPRFFARYRFNGQEIGEEIPIPADNWKRDWQLSRIPRNPDMLLQFVHLQAEGMRRSGAEDVDIRGVVKLSLNSRVAADLIDPKVNLADEPRRLLTPYPWVVPLEVPFEQRADSTGKSRHGN